MPIRNLVFILFSVLLSTICYFKADHNGYAAAVAEAMQNVKLYYVDDVDSRQLFESAIEGMVTGSLDQYSSFIGPDAFRQMEESLDQEFGGVGIEIEKPDSEPLLILSPLVDTPAYREGLRAGDKIMEIDGASTMTMSREESVTRMRGKPGTPVVLSVLRGEETEPFEVTVIREVIVVQSVLGDARRSDGAWDYQLSEDPRVGYLRVTTFGKHTVAEIREILAGADRHGFESLLLDLRGNAGGLLNAAVETCDLFIESGRIVSTRGRNGMFGRTYNATPEISVPKGMPVAILVNGFSASASEIVAACLQDHGRAVVCGQRTWGKGTVQNILEMEGGRSALRLTTATYWRPSGENIHRHKDADEEGAWGVRPDPGFEVILEEEEMVRVIESRRARDRAANQEDPQLEGDPEAEAARVEDRQLRRALEYLRRRMGEQVGDKRVAGDAIASRGNR